ncbi:hypothetical protein [Acidocella sp. MX-AZ02]|nr:hypothetical protein [Acidocella sp. MX-AZ02]
MSAATRAERLKNQKFFGAAFLQKAAKGVRGVRNAVVTTPDILQPFL